MFFLVGYLVVIYTSIQSSSANYYTYSSRVVKFIVIHYTGNAKDTAKANATYFHNGSRGASAHLFTDDDSCYQSVALNNVAWAVGGTKVYKHTECRNINSISIEMCCSGNSIVSEKTINNTAHLCAELCKYIGITADTVIRLFCGTMTCGTNSVRHSGQPKTVQVGRHSKKRLRRF